ncbi:MAG: tryptophan synthase subunit alpha [Elusimicrobiota bacterium]
MPKSRLAAVIRAANAQGRAAFIPYIGSGDPALKWTGVFVDALCAAGADIIELGVPFSDPMADGPVNQRAAERALAAGTTLSGILREVGKLRARGVNIPIVLFTYYNPIYRMGLKAFAQRARASGVDGALIVDLPPEEAGPYLKAARAACLETVFLAAPTTTVQRLRRIGAASSGFVYYVSRLGVTGERTSLSGSLAAELAGIRRRVALPVAVGFGISTPQQAAAAGCLADAVVVGSALVRIIEENPAPKAAKLLRRRARALAASLERH